MTAGVVRDLLGDLCQPADLRRLMASGEARDEGRWSSIVEMGLAGALVPEIEGGLGLNAIDFVQVAEACGYACLPEPLVENTGVALPLLAALFPDTPVQQSALTGEITVALGHPSNLLVADADTAGAFILVEEEAVHLVGPDKVRLTAQPGMDPFRRLFTVDYDARDAIASVSLDRAADALDEAFESGALFAAAQLLGIAQRCVDLAVAYAKERHQFGKPVGSYQAIKHHLATVQVRIEFARPVLYAAAARSDSDLYTRARVSHAKLSAAEAADLAARTAIQVHGAMGYSWEVDVHFFLKRAIALENWWGGPSLHRARAAERMLFGDLGPEFTFATA